MAKKRSPPNLLLGVTETQLEQVSLREAEKDKRLSSYYVARERYLDRALSFDDPVSVFVGPKGIGKSAILQMVRLERAADEKRIINVSPDDLAFHSLGNIEHTTPLLADAGRNQHLFKALWDYLLVTEVAKREYKSSANFLEQMKDSLKGLLASSEDERQLRRLLSRTFDDTGEAKSFTDRMLELITEVELTGGTGGVEASAKATFDSSRATSHHLQTLTQISQIARAITRPKALSSQYHILIDDLDLHWHNSPIQNAFIGALFLSLRKLASSPNIKCVVSLRDNIFEAIPITEKDKVRDSVCQVVWDRQALRQMVEERLVAIMPQSRPYIWSDLFPSNGFDRILSHTNQAPREVIRLACLSLIRAKRKEKRVATQQEIDQAIQEFSRERLADLASLRQYDYPGLDRLARKMQTLDPEFGYEGLEFVALAVAYEVEEHTDDGNQYNWAGGYTTQPLQLARILFEVDLLQYKATRTSDARSFDRDHDGLTEKTWYSIHPMYRAAIVGRGKS